MEVPGGVQEIARCPAHPDDHVTFTDPTRRGGDARAGRGRRMRLLRDVAPDHREHHRSFDGCVQRSGRQLNAVRLVLRPRRAVGRRSFGGHRRHPRQPGVPHLQEPQRWLRDQVPRGMDAERERSERDVPRQEQPRARPHHPRRRADAGGGHRTAAPACAIPGIAAFHLAAHRAGGRRTRGADAPTAPRARPTR